MSAENRDTVVEYRPSLMMRVWRYLGFRYGAHCGRPEDDEARYIVHKVIVLWDWRDRLRILLSGRTESELCVETGAAAKIMDVRAASVVLAPDAVLNPMPDLPIRP